ncbi:hypothetical protein BDD12DRAFT_884057 [Trichophaea hybrida]|nr:hypothetical protein BDD12DRAFT_884057 [Trichophaea hybrida]
MHALDGTVIRGPERRPSPRTVGKPGCTNTVASAKYFSDMKLILGYIFGSPGATIVTRHPPLTSNTTNTSDLLDEVILNRYMTQLQFVGLLDENLKAVERLQTSHTRGAHLTYPPVSAPLLRLRQATVSVSSRSLGINAHDQNGLMQLLRTGFSINAPILVNTKSILACYVLMIELVAGCRHHTAKQCTTMSSGTLSPSLEPRYRSYTGA